MNINLNLFVLTKALVNDVPQLNDVLEALQRAN